MSQKERVRYHQYMKPRFTNPTYASSSINDAISMASWHHNGPFNAIRRSQSSQDIFQPSLINAQLQPVTQRVQQKDAPQISANNPPRVTPKYQPNNEQRQSIEAKDQTRLSNAGSKSLKKLPLINERDIYEKQLSKYNIITIQPRQYNQTIKKYPKYRLEDMDINYFKKMQLQNQYSTMRTSQLMKNSSINQQPNNWK